MYYTLSGILFVLSQLDYFSLSKVICRVSISLPFIHSVLCLPAYSDRQLQMLIKHFILSFVVGLESESGRIVCRYYPGDRISQCISMVDMVKYKRG